MEEHKDPKCRDAAEGHSKHSAKRVVLVGNGEY